MLNPKNVEQITTKIIDLVDKVENISIEARLKRLIKNLENRHVELKLTYKLDKDGHIPRNILAEMCIKTVCGFLNGDGGMSARAADGTRRVPPSRDAPGCSPVTSTVYNCTGCKPLRIIKFSKARMVMDWEAVPATPINWNAN